MAIIFDSGEKKTELSDGKGHSIEVTYNPYDIMFLGTICDAAEKLDAEQSKLREPLQTDDWKEIYRVAMKADKAMRKILDGIFDVPICDTLFSNQTVFAVGNGFPAWSNLLLAITDSMDASLGAEKEKTQVRIKKYSSKYKK